MATVAKRKTKDGVRWLGRARVTGFKPAAKMFDTKADAAAWAANLERELKAQRITGSPASSVTQLLVAKLISEFVADPVNAARKSAEETKRLLQWWSEQAGAIRVLEFGAPTIRQCRKVLDDTKLKNGRRRTVATVNRYLSAMRSAWNWGREMGFVPAERVWPPGLMHGEAQFGRKRFLSDAELAALIKAAEADAVMKAAILVSVATGIRQGELRKLEWRDVDLDAGRIIIREAKNSETRGVHLPSSAVAAIRELKKLPVVSARFVFANSYGDALTKEALIHRWNPIRDRAMLKDFRWHDLRHSCASFLVQAGASLFEVGEVLRHKSVAMSKRYSHLIDGEAVRGHDVLDAKLIKSQQPQPA